MGRIIPTEIKEPFEQLPAGNFLLQVTGAGEGMVGKPGSEVYGIQINHTVVEPASHAGMEYDETFFIGIGAHDKQVQSGKMQADPEAANDDTWKARAGRFKRYCEKHGINIEGADLDLVFQQLTDKQLIAKVILQPSKTAVRDDGTPMMNARVDRWFAVGEAQPGIDTTPQPAAAPIAAGPRSVAPVAGPRPAGAPVAAAPAAAPGTAARPPLRRIGK
ncbi:MAG: hypothetical protein KGL39_18610 [Patescibacteria group bacterium]|nr:hypothetical protein [Patescibacteria group bacterium]